MKQNKTCIKTEVHIQQAKQCKQQKDGRTKQIQYEIWAQERTFEILIIMIRQDCTELGAYTTVVNGRKIKTEGEGGGNGRWEYNKSKCIKSNIQDSVTTDAKATNDTLRGITVIVH